MGFLSKLLGSAVSSPSVAPTPTASTSQQTGVKRYFELLREIKDLESAREFTPMLQRCSASLPLLPSLVSDCKREYGRFDIESVPAIETGCRYWAALEDEANIEIVAQAIAATPELSSWMSAVEQARRDVDLVRRLLDHVAHNPGTIQSTLGQVLGVPSEQARELAYTLAALGRLEREKAGRSYRLQLPPGSLT